MKILSFLILTVFVGTAASDYVCMQFKFVKCFSKVVIRYLQSPFCIAYPELMKCIVSGARECDVESKPLITTMLDLYTLVCTNGTELSLDNRKHKYCITEKVAIENYFCIQPMLKELAKLGRPDETREYQENHLKVTCSFLDKADECSQGNILRTCGEAAAEFRKKISLPAIALSKLACCEVGFQFEDFDCSLTQPRDEKVFELTSPSTYYSSLTSALIVSDLVYVSSLGPDRIDVTSPFSGNGHFNVPSAPVNTDRPSIASTLLGNGHFNVTSAPVSTDRPSIAYTLLGNGHFNVTSAPVSTDRPSIAYTLLGNGHFNVTSAPVSTDRPSIASTLLGNGHFNVTSAPVSTDRPSIASTLLGNGHFNVTSAPVSTDRPSIASTLLGNGHFNVTSAPVSTDRPIIASTLLGNGHFNVTSAPVSTDRPSIASTLLGNGHFNVTSAPLGTSRLRIIFSPLDFGKSKDILTSTSNNMGRVNVGSAYEPNVGTHHDSERVLSTNSEIPFSTDRLTATVAPHVTAHFETVSPQREGSALPE